ncbi:MAG: 4Fe-4S dicluster domain-containing protein [Candidatus Latescibacterota bacterium]
MAYKLPLYQLDYFLKEICGDRTVFVPEQTEGDCHLVRADAWDPEKHTLGTSRPVEPLKSLVFRPREFLGELEGTSEIRPMEDRIVLGVKNCDLSALKIQDHVFLESEPVDPYYAQAREKTLIISCDCIDCREVCFCPVVNEQPYAKDGFDINISATPLGYVIDTGSERGERAIKPARQHLEVADDAILEAREAAREWLYHRVVDQASKKGLKPGLNFQKAIRESARSRFWNTLAEDCVECGACNLVCCTCHCFLLADGLSKDGVPARVKQWDSCLYRNFARVAGGGNPRSHRAERLHNRFDKKFDYFPQILNRYACDGCGRCIEACTGKIDIREVLKSALGMGH